MDLNGSFRIIEYKYCTYYFTDVKSYIHQRVSLSKCCKLWVGTTYVRIPWLKTDRYMHICFCFVPETFRVGTNRRAERTTRLEITARAGTITQIGTLTRVATTARVGTTTQLGTATWVGTTARAGKITQLGTATRVPTTARVGTTTQLGTATWVGTTARAGTITQLGTATRVPTTARVGTKLSIYSFHLVSLLVISGMVSHRFNFDSYFEISNWDIRAEG